MIYIIPSVIYFCTFKNTIYLLGLVKLTSKSTNIRIFLPRQKRVIDRVSAHPRKLRSAFHWHQRKFVNARVWGFPPHPQIVHLKSFFLKGKACNLLAKMLVLLLINLFWICVYQISLNEDINIFGPFMVYLLADNYLTFPKCRIRLGIKI